MNEEYIVYIQTDFGELKVEFESPVLEGEEQAYAVALQKLRQSQHIRLTGLLANFIGYEVTQGAFIDRL